MENFGQAIQDGFPVCFALIHKNSQQSILFNSFLKGLEKFEGQHFLRRIEQVLRLPRRPYIHYN